jgi:SAM-dependent methyltransferase
MTFRRIDRIAVWTLSRTRRARRDRMSTAGTELKRKYVKLCDIRDFADPAVRERIDDMTPGVEPPSHLHRKHWEFAMLTLFLEDSALLREDARLLSVGAGHETVLFWLANRVAQVVATDIYGEGKYSKEEADRTMLTDPASFSPYPYRESHLEVKRMDARRLEFSDDSFDAVFALSSIEHFGSWADIRCAASEMGRVLRPGGCAYITTECFLGRSVLTPFVQEATHKVTGGRTFGSMRVFTPESLRSEIVEPSGLELVQPLDTTPPETVPNVIVMQKNRPLESADGKPFPHVAVRVKLFGARTQSWTSIGLALSKPSE